MMNVYTWAHRRRGSYREYKIMVFHHSHKSPQFCVLVQSPSAGLYLYLEEKLNHHLLTLPVSVRKDMHWNHYPHCLNGNRLWHKLPPFKSGWGYSIKSCRILKREGQIPSGYGRGRLYGGGINLSWAYEWLRFQQAERVKQRGLFLWLKHCM